MYLSTLQLKNIRSYSEETITFPKGTVLLSGDVGSGKTTILLAIEFAFFGIQRGELQADHLLKHGATQGEVTLTFFIENKEYTLIRTLKRDAKSVKQSTGSINGETCTPVELRSKVLDLFGYSQDLLTKGKSSLYRYTVYTPQEEMKRILFESTDVRLGTLRNVFGIEGYKQAQDNVSLLLREFRAEQRALKTQLEELPHKKKQLENYTSAQNTLQQKILQAQKEVEQKEQTTQQKQKTYQELQTKREEHLLKIATLNEKKTRLATQQQRLRQVQQQRTELSKKTLTKETFNEEELTLIQTQVTKKKEDLKTVEERLQKARVKQAQHQTELNTITKQEEKIIALEGKCPTCQQPITNEHKHTISTTYKEEREPHNKGLEQLNTFTQKAQRLQTQFNEQLLELEKKQHTLQTQRERVKAQAQQEKYLAEETQRLTKEEQEITPTIHLLKEEIIQLEKQQQESTILTQAQEAQEQFQQAQQSHQQSKELLISLKTQQQSEQKIIALTQEEIIRLERHAQRKEHLSRYEQWLSDYFLTSTTAIEQRVFSSLHTEFTTLFTNWFDTIIEDESLTVQLDNTFTPIILLNDYETDVTALSGGEKTALALAYRMALTQVINEFVGNIKTRDFLILDEPTDGFSTHQLDRMRDVLEQLSTEQLLIVSHDPKMETFVEHLIRVEKQGGESKIL